MTLYSHITWCYKVVLRCTMLLSTQGGTKEGGRRKREGGGKWREREDKGEEEESPDNREEARDGRKTEKDPTRRTETVRDPYDWTR